MKLPKLEDIERESQLYSKHLADGGKPIRFILEMQPTEDTIDWNLVGEFPEALVELELMWLPMFASYCREQIEKALQPPIVEEE